MLATQATRSGGQLSFYRRANTDANARTMVPSNVLGSVCMCPAIVAPLRLSQGLAERGKGNSVGAERQWEKENAS
jgi:hypothetical protein